MVVGVTGALALLNAAGAPRLALALTLLPAMVEHNAPDPPHKLATLLLALFPRTAHARHGVPVPPMLDTAALELRPELAILPQMAGLPALRIKSPHPKPVTLANALLMVIGPLGLTARPFAKEPRLALAFLPLEEETLARALTLRHATPSAKLEDGVIGLPAP